MDLELKGKHAIVTGGSRGIGKVIATHHGETSWAGPLQTRQTGEERDDRTARTAGASFAYVHQARHQVTSTQLMDRTGRWTREDLQSEDFKYRFSPLLDPYHASRYELQIKEAKRLGLIKQPFSYAQWVEPKCLQQALKELGAEGYWQPRGADGKPAREAKSATGTWSTAETAQRPLPATHPAGT